MATLPGTACRWPGCPEITKDKSGYCEQHRKQIRRQWDKQTDSRRGSARERGYDSKWERFRNWFLNQAGNQICHRCLELKGDVVKAEVVHHIAPVDERPDLRLVPDNCQPLCRNCHEEIHGRG
jgi:5-methylcytosine-specific restriction endonuclease McrA